MKKTILVLLVTLILLSNSCIYTTFALPDVSVFVNNENLISDVSPQIIDGRTLVPLRAIFEVLGLKVDWNEETKTITGTKDNTIIKLQIDSQKAMVNDNEILVTVPPMIINNRTMVPLRFMSESIGAIVDWDEKARTAYISLYQDSNKVSVFEENGLSYVSKVEGRDFYVYTNGNWEKKFLKGVNIGAGKPGSFPGELAITKTEYLRWFKYISDMNAEVIRVYTTLKPEFYDALLQFNKTSLKPLYLMQGVWINEEDISRLNNAYAENEKIKNDFIKDSTDLADVIHGNATLQEKPGFASGVYKSDVSPYVIAWILGIEWDPNFVKETNENNPTKNSYKGNYLYTENASPFECFLAEVGDTVVKYEADNYKMIRPLSYSNWPTTDILKHPNEPYPNEDMAEVNIEHIKPAVSFVPGLFASYHIYPYYPEFINYQNQYISFKNENGKINTYKAYLRDLINKHTMPVLVAEFGVPASRGMAHLSPYSGFNQGRHDEAEQGNIIQSLGKDIYDEGYCGSLVFSWQDEWFKRTWNTMDFDLPDTRPYWSNPQTNEQEFGLMAFDPGNEKSKCYVDGDISEWEGDSPIYSAENVKLFVKSDEKYLYFLAQTKDYDFNKNYLYIPIDTIQGQGNEIDKTRNIQFNRPVDFLIQIKNNDSKISVDAYYDSFYYLYGEKLKMLVRNADFTKQNSGIFNSMNLCLSREFYLPEDKKTIPFSSYETGILSQGDANPEHQNFNSLSDFSYKDENLEIRIPWQLLNVMDPSTKSIMGDIYKNKGIKAEKVDGFYVGALVSKGQTGISKIDLDYYTWEPWTVPSYHERLKPSYYILQKAFEMLK